MTFLPVDHPLARPTRVLRPNLQAGMQTLQQMDSQRVFMEQASRHRRSDQFHGSWSMNSLDPFVWRQSPFFNNGNQGGYVVDLNRNGRFDRQRDAVLAFDMNGDGRMDRRDVANTNRMMMAAVNNYDFNQDGRVSIFEQFQGNHLKARYRHLDKNRDGSLSNFEISMGGGRLWQDRNGDGRVGLFETQSPFFNSNLFGSGRRLESINPLIGHSRTSGNDYHIHYYRR